MSLTLFSGIGGFSLGLERAGMRTVAFCEIDPYCRAVLAGTGQMSLFTGVRTSAAVSWAPHGMCEPKAKAMRVERQRTAGTASQGIDLICGGFPYQDISRPERAQALRALVGPMDGIRPNCWRGTTPVRNRGERRSFAWTGN